MMIKGMGECIKCSSTSQFLKKCNVPVLVANELQKWMGCSEYQVTHITYILSTFNITHATFQNVPF